MWGDTSAPYVYRQYLRMCLDAQRHVDLGGKWRQVMKARPGLILVAALLVCSTKVFADPDPNFYIYLCFGQSNMESGGRMDDIDRTVDKRFQVMADFDSPKRGWTKGNWYEAMPPISARGNGICMVDY